MTSLYTPSSASIARAPISLLSLMGSSFLTSLYITLWGSSPTLFAFDVLTLFIPGCPDFMTLMTARARQFSDTALRGDDPTGPPAFPRLLVEHIKRTSPTPAAPPAAGHSVDSTPVYDPTHQTDKLANPFIGKNVLVLSGGADPLVPWSASQKFVDALQVGESGSKEVFVQDGKGHECTPEMVERLSAFVWEKALYSRRPESRAESTKL